MAKTPIVANRFVIEAAESSRSIIARPQSKSVGYRVVEKMTPSNPIVIQLTQGVLAMQIFPCTRVSAGLHTERNEHNTCNLGIPKMLRELVGPLHSI